MTRREEIENEVYETWRKYRDIGNSLPIEERGNFVGVIMLTYQAKLMHRKRLCDTLEKIRKSQCNTH